MATNPAMSLPESDLVRRALATCEFVAMSDCVERTDTTIHADVLLPALAWAEKDGTVTNSERCISRQRAVLPPPGKAKPDWWIICEVAKRLGFASSFSYDGPHQIFREHALLSAFENGGSRDFDIGALADADYDALAPAQWPQRAGGRPTARMFADGRFFHADGRARFVAVRPRPPAALASRDYPLLLNTGRTRDHWHSLTRTGTSPRLSRHEPEPWLAVHPEDALRFGLHGDGFALVESPYGSAVLRARIDARQRRGEVFAPMHWSDQFAAHANVGRLIASRTDPVSGQPELKCTAVRARAATMAWEAVLLTRDAMAFHDEGLIWSRSVGEGHAIYRLAGTRDIENWNDWAHNRLGAGDWIEYQDRRLGRYRAAVLRDGLLAAALFVSAPGERANVEWLAGRFVSGRIERHGRASLLAGGAASKSAGGPIVCACHQVGRAAILGAIAAQNLASVEEIGRALRAGTNCGSCIPELRGLLRELAPGASTQQPTTLSA